jgi:putative membrane protein
MTKLAGSKVLLSISLAAGFSAMGVAQTESSQSTATQSSSTSSTTDQTGNPTNTTVTRKDKSSTTTTDSNRSRSLPDDSKSMLGESDRRWMMKAAQGGMAEVQMAQLAQRQAASDQVKQFAQKLEQDHTKANQDLMNIAQQRNISIPSGPMSADEQKEMDKLSSQSGAQFDRAYIKMMVRDHRKDIKEFEKESANGMDSSLKAYASQTLPTLQSHLQMAEQLERGGTINTSSTTTSNTTSSTTDSSTTGKHSKKVTDVTTDKTTINKVTNKFR